MAGAEFRPGPPAEQGRASGSDETRSTRDGESADVPAPREHPTPEAPRLDPEQWLHPELRLALELRESEQATEQGELFEADEETTEAGPEGSVAEDSYGLPADHPQRLLFELAPPDWDALEAAEAEERPPVWEDLDDDWPPEPAERVEPEAPVEGVEPAEVEEIPGVRLLDDERLEEVGRDLVDVLDPEVWARADIPERMVLAQRAHAHIREAYGLERSPLLYDLNLPEQVAGRFDPATGQVSINAGLLEEDHPGELLDTIAHENRHSAQVELMQELHQAWDQGQDEPPGRSSVDWSTVAGWTEAWTRYDANDAVAYHSNELEVDARRAGLQLAGNGYWRAFMERLTGRDDT